MIKLRFLSVLLVLAALPCVAQTNNARMLSGVNVLSNGLPYALVPLDATRLTSFNSATAVAVTLSPGNTVGFQAGTMFSVQSSGKGLVTITCTSCLFFWNSNAGSATLTLGEGQGVDIYSQGLNYYVQGGGGGLPTNPQIGDCARYNVNGDGVWDAVNCAWSTVSVFAVLGSSPQAVGQFGGGNVNCSGNNNTNVNPTATAGPGSICGETGGNASTSTVIGLSFGANGNNSRMGMQAFYRFSAKVALGTLTNSRFWLGLATFDNSGTGGNVAAIVGTTAYATNTPNKSTEGFRCAGGTDTTFQAVAITAGASSGSQTTVNTGVACDTNIHLFEMIPNSTGTAIAYWIDNSLVATISTNLPPPANGANSWGDLFLVGDNENTTSAISATFYSMQISLKP